MEKERGDGNTILLTVIGVATLLVALVGATFAYFSTQIQNDSNQSVGITTAAPAGLSYVGKQFALTNIVPSDASLEADNGEFVVTNPADSSISQKYDLKLVIDQNDLNNFDGDKQLLLTITSDDATVANTAANVVTDAGVTNGVQWDLTNGADLTTEQQAKATAAGETSKGTVARDSKSYVFVKEATLAPGEHDTYNMTLKFADLGVTQDYNQGKTFRAHVVIENQRSI